LREGNTSFVEQAARLRLVQNQLTKADTCDKLKPISNQLDFGQIFRARLAL
jgi:hypothetical protein